VTAVHPQGVAGDERRSGGVQHRVGDLGCLADAVEVAVQESVQFLLRDLGGAPLWPVSG
jgi:hypothetical protein